MQPYIKTELYEGLSNHAIAIGYVKQPCGLTFVTTERLERKFICEERHQIIFADGLTYGRAMTCLDSANECIALLNKHNVTDRSQILKRPTILNEELRNIISKG